MSFTRETVLSALYALIDGNANFNATGRRLKLWGNQILQPSLIQRYIGENTEPLVGYGQPQRKTLHVEMWIYVKTDLLADGNSDVPETYMAPLLDALDDALAAGTLYDGRQTLGLEGYVEHAWIEGETVFSQGEENTQAQAMAVVPMRILVVAPFTAL